MTTPNAEGPPMNTTASQAREYNERRVIEKANCFAVAEGNEIVGSFAGPDARQNAQEFADLAAKRVAASQAPDVLAMTDGLTKLQGFIAEYKAAPGRLKYIRITLSEAESYAAALRAAQSTPAAPELAVPDKLVAAQGIWRDIADTAPLHVIKGKKGIFLDEATCVRLGAALEM